MGFCPKCRNYCLSSDTFCSKCGTSLKGNSVPAQSPTALEQSAANFIVILLFGWLGIHKFIQKKNGMGFLYLFTGGLFCIGWFVDSITALGEMITAIRKTKTASATPSNDTPSPFKSRSFEPYINSSTNEPPSSATAKRSPSEYVECDILKTMRTKVVGVTYKNWDDTSRQEILEYCYPGQELFFDEYIYNGAPAYGIYTGMCEQIGNLSAALASVAHDFMKSHKEKTGEQVYLSGEITEITGGNGLKYGCNIIVNFLVPTSERKN